MKTGWLVRKPKAAKKRLIMSQLSLDIGKPLFLASLPHSPSRQLTPSPSSCSQTGSNDSGSTRFPSAGQSRPTARPRDGQRSVSWGCMPAANRLVKLLLQLPLPPGAPGQPGAAHQAQKLNKQTNKTQRGGWFLFFVLLCYFGCFYFVILDFLGGGLFFFFFFLFF